MSESKEEFPFSFDSWLQKPPFSEWLGKLPISAEKLVPMEKIQDYVEEMVQKSLRHPLFKPGTAAGKKGDRAVTAGTGPGLPVPDVFETHRSVIVRVKVPKRVDPAELRVRYNPRELKVSGLTPSRTMRIKLPAAVASQGHYSRLRGGILEVRLRKTRRKGKEKELFVRY